MDIEKIKYTKISAYERISKVESDDMYNYADEYIDFLNKSKTEYKCVEQVKKELNEVGFVDINDKEKLVAGDKIYFENNERAIYIAVIGSKMMNAGTRIIGSHIDSPRLDTKPMPLYEEQNVAMMKTQYYGGIRKYQWLSIPLSMYATVYTKDGVKHDIIIGEEDDEFNFTIPDLLPHLSKEQEQKKASEFVDAENLNVLVASVPSGITQNERIKAKALEILNKKYGLVEMDLARADIRFVPCFKAKYVGLDKGMIGGYGQDDRVCSFAVMTSLANITKEEVILENTLIGLLVDKEEIGSEGNTSMKSEMFEYFIEQLIKKTDSTTNVREVLVHSKMLSGDVSAGVDPSYANLSDIPNANIMGCGIAIEKYTGSGGKYCANDASARYVSYCMSIFDDAQVCYQMGTLSKIEKGGGGTIAYILANKGVEVVDCGPAILGMHSPYELASTADVYMTYKAYKAFYKAK